MKNPRRLKLALIVIVLLASTLALFAWTQVWVHAQVIPMGSGQKNLDVTGSTAAPALTALALAGFALAGALTIAGRIIRVVLGILEVLLGVSVFISAFMAVSDPALASSSAVTAATGIAGSESIRVGVVDASTTPWPFLALAAAVVMVIAGIAIVVSARRWPGPTARYQGARFEPVASPDAPGPAAGRAAGPEARPATHPAGDPVGDWDELSRGQDPTA